MEYYKKCLEKISKVVISSGHSLRKPSEGSVCSITIKTFKFAEDNVPSDYISQESSSVTIGFADNLVDRLIEYCLCTMEIKEESQFVLHFHDISMELMITLSDCSFKPYSFQMCDTEKLELATTFKEQGTLLFRNGNISHAFVKFQKALRYLLTLKDLFHVMCTLPTTSVDHEGNVTKTPHNLIVVVYNNLAFCQLHFKNYDHVILLCSQSLGIIPNIKAYYRRALALVGKSLYDDAINDLAKALKLEKGNKAAINQLKLVKELKKADAEKCKASMKKLYSIV